MPYLCQELNRRSTAQKWRARIETKAREMTFSEIWCVSALYRETQIFFYMKAIWADMCPVNRRRWRVRAQTRWSGPIPKCLESRRFTCPSGVSSSSSRVSHTHTHTLIHTPSCALLMNGSAWDSALRTYQGNILGTVCKGGTVWKLLCMTLLDYVTLHAWSSFPGEAVGKLNCPIDAL